MRLPKERLRPSVRVILGGLLAFALAAAPGPFADTAIAQSSQDKMGKSAVKYVVSVDYPLGGKAKYIAWVKSIAADLSAPSEVRRITSYDDFFGASPNRVIEFEFDSMQDAGKYFANEKVLAVFQNWNGYGVNAKIQVLSLRSDYEAKK